jgi:hypothetical protein
VSSKARAVPAASSNATCARPSDWQRTPAEQARSGTVVCRWMLRWSFAGNRGISKLPGDKPRPGADRGLTTGKAETSGGLGIPGAAAIFGRSVARGGGWRRIVHGS